MSIRINNIILDIEENIETLKKKVAKKLKVEQGSIKNFKILRESIDARKKNSIKFNYTVELNYDREEKLVKRCRDKDVRLEEEKNEEKFVLDRKSTRLN